ncbi:hypothetical protein EXIGLDRAFT_721520 [Exidia glandulosa HHB12029]|uniref:DUF6699 domain-containing protein n=1 Tax=Exidia glandulosa HHB12029 TaxID=1314781 RepID=A0A165FPZ9_EXIGL|nr:hypothetical protein EXIGLDRAFT_721520 [Exidia glandulosa HHB12029]
MLKKNLNKHVSFQLPEGYELEESPLPSTSHLPTIFPATTAAQPIAPVERTSPPRAAKPIAAETSHLPVAAIQRQQPRTPVVPPMGQTPSVPSTALPPLPPLVRKPEGQAEAVIPPIPASTPHPALNPLLRPHALTYNLLFESNIATADRGSLTAYQREQPATNPAVRRMVIMPIWSRSRAPPAGFPKRLIEVESPVSRASPVALVNVLDAVHEWLHQPVEQDAWSRSSQEEQRIAGTAFWERVRRAGPPFEQERVRVQGLRRIDYLGDRTYFGGLRPLPHQPEIWMLDLTPATAAR